MEPWSYTPWFNLVWEALSMPAPSQSPGLGLNTHPIPYLHSVGYFALINPLSYPPSGPAQPKPSVLIFLSPRLLCIPQSSGGVQVSHTVLGSPLRSCAYQRFKFGPGYISCVTTQPVVSTTEHNKPKSPLAQVSFQIHSRLGQDTHPV